MLEQTAEGKGKTEVGGLGVAFVPITEYDQVCHGSRTLHASFYTLILQRTVPSYLCDSCHVHTGYPATDMD